MLLQLLAALVVFLFSCLCSWDINSEHLLKKNIVKFKKFLDLYAGCSGKNIWWKVLISLEQVNTSAAYVTGNYMVNFISKEKSILEICRMARIAIESSGCTGPLIITVIRALGLSSVVEDLLLPLVLTND